LVRFDVRSSNQSDAAWRKRKTTLNEDAGATQMQKRHYESWIRIWAYLDLTTVLKQLTAICSHSVAHTPDQRIGATCAGHGFDPSCPLHASALLMPVS
jgi:hypothetical protein